MSKPTMTIIGAGLSGLTLSRCLQKRGVPSTIYERTPSPAQHSYGITLHASTYTPLLQALDTDERAFKSRVAVDATIGGTGKIGGDSTRCFRANRGKLEEWLLEGVDVRWGWKLGDVERAKDVGATVLRFDNGEKVESDVVVGADGAHSALRQSVLPDCKLDILPYVTYNGKRRITHKEFEKAAPYMEGGNIVNFEYGNARMNVSVNEYTEDRVSVSWTYSRPSHGPSDPLHRPGRSLSDATQIPDEVFDELSDLRTSLPDPISRLFYAEVLRGDRILHWLQRSFLVPKPDLKGLAEGGVVLIGDAAHAQPIVGGQGANEAILDALSMAERIANGEALDGWIEERYLAWQDGVDKAKTEIERMHGESSERL